MRDIKFRAWDKAGKTMSDPFTLRRGNLIWRSKNETAVTFKALLEEDVVMQYTGLKDKHGDEIYEGDVIQHERKSRPYSDKAKIALVKCIVQWLDGKSSGDNLTNPSSFNQNPSFIGKPIGDHKSNQWSYDWSEFHDCEVIGNIYENPELCQ